MALGGTAGAFGLAALLIGVSLPMLLTIRVGRLPADDDKARGAVMAELRDGLRRIRRHPVLRPLVLAIALSDLGFVGPMNLGLTLLSQQRGWGRPGWAGCSPGSGPARVRRPCCSPCGGGCRAPDS